jgi:hypothetical protein
VLRHFKILPKNPGRHATLVVVSERRRKCNNSSPIHDKSPFLGDKKYLADPG